MLMKSVYSVTTGMCVEEQTIHVDVGIRMQLPAFRCVVGLLGCNTKHLWLL